MPSIKRHEEDIGRIRRCPAYWLRRGLLASSLIVLTTASMATTLVTPTESPSSIRNAARAFIVQQIEHAFPDHSIEISDLDQRLKLPACHIPLEGFLPPGGHLPGNTSIGVRCRSTKAWAVYVPAIVKVMHPVVVAKYPLLGGMPIEKADLVMETREISSNINDFFFDTDRILGMVAKHPVLAATALTPDMLDTPLLVRRGQQIVILAEGSGLEVRISGMALMDGAQGQWVRAQSTDSKRLVEGLVIKPGIIQVNM